MKASLLCGLLVLCAGQALAQPPSTAGALARMRTIQDNIAVVEAVGAMEHVEANLTGTLMGLAAGRPPSERDALFSAAQPVVEPIIQAHRLRLRALVAAHGALTAETVGEATVRAAALIERGGPAPLQQAMAPGAAAARPSPAPPRVQAIFDNLQVVEEIGAMEAADQALRNAMLDVSRTQSAVEREATYRAGGAIIASVDQDHVRRLRAIVARYGWPTVSGMGERTARSAATLANHGGPEVLAEAVALMQPLVARKEVVAEDYARLSDRLATQQKRPQTYATQGTACAGGKYVTPSDVEDPARLDERRASVGLAPMAVYLEQLNRLYGGC